MDYDEQVVNVKQENINEAYDDIALKNEGYDDYLETTLETHICDQCDKKFKTKSGLANHFKLVHGEDEDISDVIISDKFGTGSNHWKKMCHICNTEVSAKGIEKHVKLCLKYFQFVGQQKVEDNVEKVEDNVEKVGDNVEKVEDNVEKNVENPDKYTCKLCEKSGFQSIGFLYYHIKATHNSEYATGDGNFSCPTCQKEFSSKVKVKSHIKKVHEERPRNNSCSVCGKAFLCNATLKRHVEDVHEKRKYKCDFKASKI